ncbi:MAG: hypothetical protein ABJN36_05790 [Cyclobacteriaceae bacterium]
MTTPPKSLTLLLLILVTQLGMQQSFAQLAFFKSLKARSISTEFTRNTGSFRNEGFDQFSSEAKFGDLFTDPGPNYSWYGQLETNSFNLLMNFRMKDTTRFRHEFVAGIKKINQRVLWLDGDDTRYRGRSELMKGVVGYKYYLIKRKRIRFSAGSQVDFGFTVSSFTKENGYYESSEYFGNKGLQGGIEFPFVLEVRPFRGFYFYLGRAFGAGFYSQDGAGQVIFAKSIITGMRFNI